MTSPVTEVRKVLFVALPPPSGSECESEWLYYTVVWLTEPVVFVRTVTLWDKYTYRYTPPHLKDIKDTELLAALKRVAIFSLIERLRQDPSLGLEWNILRSEHTELVGSGSAGQISACVGV